MLILNNYRDAQEIKAKETIMNNYNISCMIAAFVNRTMAGKQLPKLSELYPEFKEAEDEATIRNYIHDFEQFAIMHNKGV